MLFVYLTQIGKAEVERDLLKQYNSYSEVLGHNFLSLI